MESERRRSVIYSLSEQTADESWCGGEAEGNDVWAA